jgi:hypothetical protein
MAGSKVRFAPRVQEEKKIFMRQHHLLGLALACLVPTLAANTIPDAQFSVQADDYQGNLCILSGPGTCHLGGTGSTSATLDSSGRLMTMTTNALVLDQTFRYAYTDAKYGFEVLGGNPSDAVQVDILFSISASATPDSGTNAYALSRVNGQGTTVDFYGFQRDNFSTAEVCQGQNTTICNGFLPGSTSGVISVLVSPGQIGNIDLTTAVQMYGNGTGNAFLDPVLSINPNQPNASLYTLQLSPGIPNGELAASPEPTSSLLAGSAILLVGISKLRRKAKKR